MYGLLPALSALALGACVSATPLEISDDSPVSMKASSGFVASPAAIEEYKSPADFTTRAEEDAKAPAMDHSAHSGMSMPATRAPQVQPERAPAMPGPAHDHAH
jgi:hypothetical protein